MPTSSLRFRFQQRFHVPARAAFAWCTDFSPEDAAYFRGTQRRKVEKLAEGTLIMTDTSVIKGKKLAISRLVRIDPDEMAWTNTHLNGPYKYSQYWYRVVPDSPRSSHLDFEGLRLETVARDLTAKEVRDRTEVYRRANLDQWRSVLAPALEAELKGAKSPSPRAPSKRA